MSQDRDTHTPRRSKRFQPLVAASDHRTELYTYAWSSDSIYSRPTQVDDIDDEEKPNQDKIPDTLFYESFTRTEPTRAGKVHGRTKGKGKERQVDEGIETFKVGDTVLVATSARKPSVGVIVSMWQVTLSDDYDSSYGVNGDGEVQMEMRVRVHWFLRPTELAGVRAHRDHFENEVYYSLITCATFSPSKIIARCAISSAIPEDAESKSALAWSMSPSKRRKISVREPSNNELYFCRSAIDARRGLFYVFDWEQHREKSLSCMVDEPWNAAAWDVAVDDTSAIMNEGVSTKKRVTATRGMKKERLKINEEGDGEHDDQNGASEDEDFEVKTELLADASDEEVAVEDDIPKTPSKKRKRATGPSQPTTPRTPRRKKTAPQALAAPTPHSKAALRARARRKSKSSAGFLPPAPELTQSFSAALRKIGKDPWLRAMHVLHVAARPDELVCREQEYKRVLRSVEELVEEGSGGCIYISGVPGTGKTATVHAIVRELKRMAQNSETNPFNYVEINGLKIPEPSAAYGLLWESVSGHDVASEGHLKTSSKEALRQLTRHFSGSGDSGPGGHACVVLMDELDQLVTAKQDVVYNFFNWPTLVGSKLVVIAVANTMDLPERVMSGRVRSRLGMIRINFQPYTTPQLEKIVHSRLVNSKEGLSGQIQDVISADGVKFAAMKVSSISGDARRVLDICRRTVELVHPLKRTARTDDVKAVIKVMQNSPTAAYLRECSFHERLMLAALLKCMKNEGVEEIKWGDVQYQHLIYMNVLTGEYDPSRRPTQGELNMVLDSLLASRAVLMEDGAVAWRKMEEDRKVILNLEQGEVERALGDVGGQRWKNALSV